MTSPGALPGSRRPLARVLPAVLAADLSRVLLGALAVLVVGLQISYPLLHGGTRAKVTVVIVCLFAATCLAHATLTRGPATAVRVLLASAGVGYLVELLGVHTGFPFGTYAYAAVLGPRVADVPVVVPLAWTMLAWPAALAARRLVAGPLARVVVGAWALASADLFLDPQMVTTGAWTWSHPSPHLPGVDAVPLTNFAGWLLAALVVSAAVQAVLGADAARVRAGDGPAIGLYLWLWAGWAVAQLFFLDLPGSAAWGTVGMGLVAVPLAHSYLRPHVGQGRTRVGG